MRAFTARFLGRDSSGSLLVQIDHCVSIPVGANYAIASRQLEGRVIESEQEVFEHPTIGARTGVTRVWLGGTSWSSSGLFVEGGLAFELQLDVPAPPYFALAIYQRGWRSVGCIRGVTGGGATLWGSIGNRNGLSVRHGDVRVVRTVRERSAAGVHIDAIAGLADGVTVELHDLTDNETILMRCGRL